MIVLYLACLVLYFAPVPSVVVRPLGMSPTLHITTDSGDGQKIQHSRVIKGGMEQVAVDNGNASGHQENEALYFRRQNASWGSSGCVLSRVEKE